MDRIFLENFRCFHERQEARLAPLTLLVGENSTGKTSFLALIRALWNTAYSGQPPDFKAAPYDLGSFDEIAHFRGGRAGRADRFESGFIFPSSSTRFDVTFGSKANAPTPVKFRLGDKKQNTWMEYDRQHDRLLRCSICTPNGHWVWNIPEHSLFYGYNILQLTLVYRPEIFQTMSDEWELVSGPSNSPCYNDWKILENLLRNFLPHHHLNRQVYASAPVRSKPRRTYERSQLRWDAEGDYIPMYLANVHSQKADEWNNIRNNLEAFGHISGLFDEISVRSLGSKPSDPFQLQIRKRGQKSKGPFRNLIDVGYGVSQALPVVTELLHGEAPLFLLQQPEVHLHPSAQAALGSLFCQIASPERQLVVETHSDHLLDRVRMDVRDGEGELKPEDVSILFFEQGDLDVRIHSLGLDGDGNVLGAPAGYRDFFKAELRRSVGL